MYPQKIQGNRERLMGVGGEARKPLRMSPAVCVTSGCLGFYPGALLRPVRLSRLSASLSLRKDPTAADAVGVLPAAVHYGQPCRRQATQ